MLTIYKYNLELTDVQDIEMPIYAKIVHVGWQIGSFNSGIKIWALVQDTLALKSRRIHIVGTGNGMPELPVGANVNHLGTVLTPDGFVWHVFEEV